MVGRQHRAPDVRHVLDAVDLEPEVQHPEQPERGPDDRLVYPLRHTKIFAVPARSVRLRWHLQVAQQGDLRRPARGAPAGSARPAGTPAHRSARARARGSRERYGGQVAVRSGDRRVVPQLLGGRPPRGPAPAAAMPGTRRPARPCSPPARADVAPSTRRRTTSGVAGVQQLRQAVASTPQRVGARDAASSSSARSSCIRRGRGGAGRSRPPRPAPRPPRSPTGRPGCPSGRLTTRSSTAYPGSRSTTTMLSMSAPVEPSADATLPERHPAGREAATAAGTSRTRFTRPAPPGGELTEPRRAEPDQDQRRDQTEQREDRAGPEGRVGAVGERQLLEQHRVVRERMGLRRRLVTDAAAEDRHQRRQADRAADLLADVQHRRRDPVVRSATPPTAVNVIGTKTKPIPIGDQRRSPAAGARRRTNRSPSTTATAARTR